MRSILALVLASAALAVAARDVQVPDLPTFYVGQPVYLEWYASDTEVADGILKYQIAQPYYDFDAEPVRVTIPSPTGLYRFQLPVSFVRVGTWDLALRGCTAKTCSDVQWTRYKVVAAPVGLPLAPGSLRVAPPPAVVG